MMRLLPALAFGLCLAACSSPSTAPSAHSTSPTTPTGVTSVAVYFGSVAEVGVASEVMATVSPSGVRQDVTWSVTGPGCSGASCGTIGPCSGGGTCYTAPATVPTPATVTLTARSVADSTKSASTTATIFQLTGQPRTFVFDRSLSGYVDAYQPGSFFNLYDNGAFVLEYPAVGTGPGYFGAYTEANGAITFAWEGWNIAGPWGATGTLNGDSLTVNFNDTMQGTDFDSAVYTLEQTAGSHRISRLLVRQGEEPRRALVDQKLSPQGRRER